MSGGHLPDGARSRLFGVYPALVTDLQDPQQQGRVQVKLPWLGSDGEKVTAWATLVTPYADDDQGFEMLPEIDSMVVVAFEAGDLERPYILGAAWNGTTTLPAPPDNTNNLRVIKTRAGSRLEFDDTTGAPTVAVTVAGDKSGAVHKIVMDDAGDSITIKARNGAEVSITAGGGITVRANTSVSVNAPTVDVTAAMSTFSGVVKCDTLIATTVVGATYTPGVGNIW